jgi:para-nitrobenzyl esterase
MSITVRTSLGRVRGEERDGVRMWRGIPYAAAPVGGLRFRPPQSIQPWDGVRDATRFAPTAMQSDAFRLDQQVNIPEPRSSEDCLYLNVWAPAEPSGPQPVMVWIHGGGFVEGAGSDDHYDGARLVRNGGVVVVTLNYRLGAFGFLYFAALAPDYADASNLGLRDQIAALRWVHDNIGAFGGDPDQVTVFGESAGGISIAALMAMPEARGLFRRAIIQSGGTYARAAQSASEIARELLAELGVSDPRQLRTLPAPDIQAASERYLERVAAPLSLHVGPVVDGESLPRHPLEAIRAGSAQGVALIAGSNRDEGDLFYPVETPPSSAAYETSRALFSPCARARRSAATISGGCSKARSGRSARRRSSVSIRSRERGWRRP